MSKTYRVPIFLALLALTVCMGSLQAAALTAGPAVTVRCDTSTGPAAAVTLAIKTDTALGTASAVTASVPVGTGLTITPPAPNLIKATTDSAVFSFVFAAGCVGTATTQSITFSATGAASVTSLVTIQVTKTTTGLSTPSNSVTVTCVKNSATSYTAGIPQVLSLTSTATGGTPFTVGSSPALPDWLTVTPSSGTATAAKTSLTFTPVAIAGGTACGGLAAKGTTSFAVKLKTEAPDKTITVNLTVFDPSPLIASPSPATLTYVKGSGAAGRADVSVTTRLSTPSFFSVDTSSLPIWLTVDSVTGLTPKMPRFSTTGIADTLAPGTYKATVTLQVSGFGDLLLPFSLLVTNPTPKFSIQEGLTRTLSWKPGDAPPTATITAVSTGSAIPYSITTSGTLAPIIQPSFLNGLAYSFGTGIPVTFDPLTFAAAQPGSTLTGTVTFTWGSPASTTVVTIAVNITSSAATLTSIAPASLPTSAAGQSFYVTLVGSGFVPSLDPAQKTKVGVVASPGAPVVSNTNISWTVVDTAKISLTITVPAVADTALPFAVDKTGGPVTIGVCNPTALTGTCTVPTGTVTLTIGNSPIIQAVTSASAFIQVSAPSQTVAPYDIVSIFGTNFCTSGGTGCSSTQVLAGTPDTVTKTLAYPTWLSPDDEKVGGNPNPKRRLLTVTFQTHATPAVVIAAAPLLFATNNQINVMAPAALKNYYDQQVDIVVSFGYGSVPATLLSSGAYGVTVKNASPGIFTVGSDGQGDGAILNSNWALVGATQPAGMRASSTDSDSIQIYMTGLGEPTSTAANTANSSPVAWSTDCVSIDNYKASLIANTASVATLDGVVINSAWLAKNRFQPCIPSSAGVAVTIGAQPATVLYAGWVQDSIAGLYQVNAQLPSLTPDYRQQF